MKHFIYSCPGILIPCFITTSVLYDSFIFERHNLVFSFNLKGHQADEKSKEALERPLSIGDLEDCLSMAFNLLFNLAIRK